MTDSRRESERFHALDAVRAFALLSGIFLHAAMTFMPGLANFGFPADYSLSPALEIAFYIIHIFRMTLFFVIAGFFSHLIFHRKGFRQFLLDRAKRIFVPFIVGWLFFGPLIMMLLYISLAPVANTTTPPTPPAGFPLAHLWFLYYLMLIYAVVLILRAFIAQYPDRDGRLHAAIDKVLSFSIRKHLALPILAAAVAGCLLLKPGWMMWEGIASPDTGLLPQWSAMGCFGIAFVFGWLLHRQHILLAVWKNTWILYLSLAAGFAVLSLWLLKMHPNPVEVDPAIKLVYALSYALSIWCWVFGLIGVALRFFDNKNSMLRYLADASYWMYLAHLPLVFALQMLVLEWPLHWSIKFPLIVGIALTILLLSYHFLVRSTWLGEILNGCRRVHTHVDSVHTDDSSLSTNQYTHVAEVIDVHKRYGNEQALNGLNLHIRPGELFALLGPNGAGKSTAISCMLGLHNPDAGLVKIFGCAPQTIDARRKCGVMLQDIDLPPELRVRELIELSASYYGTPLPVNEIMQVTHTTSIAKRAYGKLSGGQKRLAQFAIALCGNPKLLFLDEPTVGMDTHARQMLWTTLRQLVQNGCSIVLTTHYLEEAEALADRVAVMVKGKIVTAGTVNDIRAQVTVTPVTCSTQLDSTSVAQWPGVIDVQRDGERLLINASHTDDLVRRLSVEDPNFRELEIGRPKLGDAFNQITREFAQ